MPKTRIELPDVEADVEQIRRAFLRIHDPFARYCFAMIAESIADHMAEAFETNERLQQASGLVMASTLASRNGKPSGRRRAA